MLKEHDEVDIKALLVKINRTQKLLGKHSKNLSILKKKLEEACTHDEVVVEETYFEGSYFDHASTMIRTNCAICGKLLKSEEKVHSWYG